MCRTTSYSVSIKYTRGQQMTNNVCAILRPLVPNKI